MKLDALDHPKTLDLASRLDVSLPTVIGHLELLWAFTGKKAPQGNIGKWPDGAIARACYWMGNAEAFVRALIDARFIDENNSHRLVIHDWHEHAPRWVKSKLHSMSLSFIQKETKIDTSEDTEEDVSEDTSEDTSSDSKGRVTKGYEGFGNTTAAERPSLPPELIELKSIYPPRAGGNPWPKALKAINARLREGHTWTEILDGARRYSEFVRVTGKAATEYVKQAATFCGPDKFFLESWHPPPTKAAIQQDANVAAGLEWLRASENADAVQ